MATKIQNKLYQLADTKYRTFSLRLLPESVSMIGVRLPVLRKLSQKISLEELTDETFEEVMLQGMIIGHIQEFSLFQEKCLLFLPKIDNWSICDSFVASLKITRKYPQEMLSFLESLVASPLIYTRRFVIVSLLHDYLEKEFMDSVTSILKQMEKGPYYVDMAISWLLAELYSKDSSKVLAILSSKEYNLNRFIFRKTISKIHDSLKVSKEDKEYLRAFSKKYENIWEDVS